jgi:sugar phosphate isomerase/epimerase
MTRGAPTRAWCVGLDNYGLFPLGLSPLDTLRWAVAHGADGVAFSGLAPEWAARMDTAALAEIRAFAAERGLYLEWGGAQHIPRDMTSWARKDLFEINRGAAREAAAIDATIVRSCSGGLMRWDAANPPTEVLLRDTAEALRGQETMWRDHGAVLAIETHFEFTSFELLRLFDMCETEPGGWLGICLDTMNLMTMIEHPMMATRRLLPWVVSTHMKDGGVLSSRDGLSTFPVALGAGVIDLAAIIRLVDTLERPVHLSVEDHGGSFRLPIHDGAFISRFPDLAGAELRALLELAETAQANPGCRPLERAEWPGLCESRIAHDLRQLRRLAGSVSSFTEALS